MLSKIKKTISKIEIFASTKKALIGFIILLYVLFSYLSYDYSIKDNGYYNYNSTLWADKSGYYVYLPALFVYNFDGEKMPVAIEDKVGLGFYIDKETHKIITKYTAGVAMLTFPFFLIAHVSAVIQGCGDGFGPPYHQMVAFVAPFFALLGLVFLFLFLINYVRKRTAFFTCLILLTGTNLFYYTVSDGYMSHAYSFFLFALLLYSSKKYIDTGYAVKWFSILVASIFFIVLIRPTDFLVFLIIPFIYFSGFKNVKTLISSFFTIKKLAIILALFVLIIGPQMLYWKYASGSWFVYSYGNEGFKYIASPKILEVLFSARCGLLIYNPLYIILLASLIYYLFIDFKKAIWLLLLIVIVIYIIASWHSWFYGCSYGIRPMVQYTAVLALPFAIMIKRLEKRPLFKNIIMVLVILTTIYSLIIVYSYDRCYLGDDWNYSEYFKYIDKFGINDIICNYLNN